MYDLKLLSKKEIHAVLEDYLLRDFGDEEVLPNILTKELAERHLLKAIGLYKGDELTTYGLFHTIEPHTRSLLGYFATLEPYRNQGLGSKYFELLHEAFESGRTTLGRETSEDTSELIASTTSRGDNFQANVDSKLQRFFIEVDEPSFAPNPTEAEHRQRRIDFYKRNGFQLTPLISHILHSKFRIMICDYADIPNDAATCQRELLTLYRTLFAEHFLTDHVAVSIDKEARESGQTQLKASRN